MKKIRYILFSLLLAFSSCSLFEEKCYHCTIEYESYNNETRFELDSLAMLLGYQAIAAYVDKRKDELIDWVEDWGNHCWSAEAIDHTSLAGNVDDLDANGVYDI